jgi:hypothetical protein
MRFLNERSMHPHMGLPGTAPHCTLELLEPRLLLATGALSTSLPAVVNSTINTAGQAVAFDGANE